MARLLVFNFLMIAFTAHFGFAAPIPGTSSSILTDPQKGLQFAKHHVQLDLANTAWTLKNDDSTGENVALEFTPKNAPENSMAQLSLRLSDLKKATAFDEYIKHTMKEYPQFGFAILNSQKINLRGQDTFVVDLVQKKKHQSLRQVLFMNGKRVAVFTCLDDELAFKSTLSDCNKLIETFHWL